MRKAYLIDQKVINIDSHNPNGQLAQASKECFAVATHVCRERQYTFASNLELCSKAKSEHKCPPSYTVLYDTVRT